jgi:tetratricopeptide (TPR) repeat protein
MNAGAVCYARGQVERALHHLSAAADAYRGLAMPYNEAAARTNLGTILSSLCRFDEANRHLELAVPWLVEGKYYSYLIANRNTRAANALIAGEARRAVEFASQARSFAATLDAEAGPRAVTAQRQIDALRRLGRFREALEVYSRARDDFLCETNADCRGIDLEAVPLFLDFGRHDRAKVLLVEFEQQSNLRSIDVEQALVYRLRVGNASSPAIEAPAAEIVQAKTPVRWCALAVEVAPRMEGPDALAMLDRALGQARDLGLNAHLAGLWIAMAEQRFRQDDRSGARLACDEAAEALADFDADSYRPGLLLRLLKLERQLGRDDRADACLKEAVNWVRRAEDVHVPAEFRASFLHRNPVNRELLTLAKRVS